MTYEKALTALADPTRRALVERLSSGPRSVGALAADLPVSRPAVSQHLRVLCDAGLLDVTTAGTRRIYRLAPNGPRALRAYLDRLWSDALDAFAQAAAAEAKPSPPPEKDAPT